MYNLMGKTAGLTVVQKTATDTLLESCVQTLPWKIKRRKKVTEDIARATNKTALKVFLFKGNTKLSKEQNVGV